MGKKRLPKTPITNKKLKRDTFKKRLETLERKGYELSKLCSCCIFFSFNNNDNSYFYSFNKGNCIKYKNFDDFLTHQNTIFKNGGNYDKKDTIKSQNVEHSIKSSPGNITNQDPTITSNTINHNDNTNDSIQKRNFFSVENKGNVTNNQKLRIRTSSNNIPSEDLVNLVQQNKITVLIPSYTISINKSIPMFQLESSQYSPFFLEKNNEPLNLLETFNSPYIINSMDGFMVNNETAD